MEERGRVLPLVRQERVVAAKDRLEREFREIEPRLLRFAMRLVERDAIEDVVQEAVLRYLAKQRDDPAKSQEDLAALLIGNVRQEAFKHNRSARRRARMVQFLTDPRLALRRWMSPTRPTHDRELRERIAEALEKLPASWREPWILTRELGMSVPFVAMLLGIQVDSCRAAISKANQRLRQLLEASNVTPSLITSRTDA